MPVRKVKGGYQWGEHGKVYPTKEQAEKQGQAAYANGYTGDSGYKSHFSVPDFDYEDDVDENESPDSVQKNAEFGRLRIKKFPISKEDVNVYRGREINDYEAAGLEPDKLYKLYRPAEELIKASDTFEMIPITVEHPEDVDTPFNPQDRSGTTGSEAYFEAPYMYTSAKLWGADAIAGVKSKFRKEVSIYSKFEVELTPGEFDGKPYDGIIRNIKANSVALTIAGRVGQDVAVGDSDKERIRAMNEVKELLKNSFKGVPDSELDRIHEEIMRLTKQNADAHKTIEKEIKANGDSEGEGVPTKGKPYDGLAKATGDDGFEDDTNEDDDDDEATGDSEEDKAEDKAEKMGKGSEKAVGDSALNLAITRAKKEAVDLAQKRFGALLEAMRIVEPVYGKITGDSATEVYQAVLRSEGIDTNVHPSAYKSLVQLVIANKQAANQRTAATGDSALYHSSADYSDYL